MTRASWPQEPPIEDEATLEAYLDRAGADATGRRFCRELARNGVARLDLGDAARGLCTEAAADMDRRFARTGASRLQDAWLRSRAVRRLALDEQVARLLHLAYGRPAFAFQTLNFRVGTEQATHADAIHFHSAPERFMCGVWVALEDIGPGAGPLLYRPGSHRLPVLTMGGAGVNHPQPTHDDYRRTYLPALASRLDAAGLPVEHAVLRRGEALVWTANLAHGGAPITDPAATRRSLVTHYFFDDCLYYTPMTSDIEGGRLAMRLPRNVGTGGVVWPRRDGRRARVPLRQIAGAARTLLLREVRAS